MAIMEKRIFLNINDVTSYLESIGFTISGNKILWSYAESDTDCYWKIDNDIITFQRSDGQNAFATNLVDFNMENRPKCAIVIVKLQDNGIALYMGMIASTTGASDIFPCCKVNDGLLNNGLVVLSPREDDGHWYYGWNDHDWRTESDADNVFRWSMDNGHGNYEYGQYATQLGQMQMIPNLPNNITLSKIYLNSGYWSKNIFVQLMGTSTPPGSIFKIQGQKYVSFTSNTSLRCPVYKLAADPIEQNLSTSTDPYSSLRTYVVGDYCTFNGYVYRCTTSIQTPEPFDDSKWVQTTVPNELLTAGDHIYGA